MSMLDDYTRRCVLMVRHGTPSPAGGERTQWTEGAEFIGYLALDTSMEARRAEKEGVKSLYSVLVGRDVPVQYGDYIKDMATGLTYRITSNPGEKQTPGSSTLDLKYFTAERSVLPQ